jgi:error-prone DNA polymerase
VSQRALELLAEADAFASVGPLPARRPVGGQGAEGRGQGGGQAPLLAGLPLFEDAVALPTMAMPQQVAEDYRTTSLSLKAHPLRFFRPAWTRLNVIRPSG